METSGDLLAAYVIAPSCGVIVNMIGTFAKFPSRKRSSGSSSKNGSGFRVLLTSRDGLIRNKSKFHF